MEVALWVLVVVVAWSGLAVTTRLKEIAKETKYIRQYLEMNGEFKNISIPSHLLHRVTEIGESVLARDRDDKLDGPSR